MQWSAFELRKACEEGRIVGPSTSSRLSVTGEPYVVIGHQVTMPSQPGVVDEGQEMELAFDEETAYLSALGAFELYAENRPGKLYWRIAPELGWFKKARRCAFYMRCLISDKEEVAK